MRLLLDTQIFIWWDGASQRMPPGLLALLNDESTLLFLSVASIWEIQIKHQLGKLDLDRPLPQIISEQQQTNQLKVLAVQAEDIYGLQQLPFYHKDPFDRLIIAQALLNDLALASVDAIFQKYPVRLVNG